MIKIMMLVSGEENRAKYFTAAEVLQHVNSNEDITVLQQMSWPTDNGKLNFLMGKSTALIAEVAEPLTESEAQQALKEYKELMGLK